MMMNPATSVSYGSLVDQLYKESCCLFVAQYCAESFENTPCSPAATGVVRWVLIHFTFELHFTLKLGNQTVCPTVTSIYESE